MCTADEKFAADAILHEWRFLCVGTIPAVPSTPDNLGLGQAAPRRGMCAPVCQGCDLTHTGELGFRGEAVSDPWWACLKGRVDRAGQVPEDCILGAEVHTWRLAAAWGYISLHVCAVLNACWRMPICLDVSKRSCSLRTHGLMCLMSSCGQTDL